MQNLSKKELSILTDKELREKLSGVLSDIETLRETVLSIQKELEVREKKVSKEEKEKSIRMMKKVLRDLTRRGRLLLCDGDYLITDGKLLARIKDPSNLEFWNLSPENFKEITKELQENVEQVYDQDRPFVIAPDTVEVAIAESGMLRAKIPNGIIWRKLEHGPCVSASLYLEGIILSERASIHCGTNFKCPVFMDGDDFEVYLFPRAMSNVMYQLEPGFYGLDGREINDSRLFCCQNGRIKEIPENQIENYLEEDLER